MSFSPVPGAGTLLRVEEVRQRLNQCGLQGEKVTRKTARKYVPPTATASRTVADMARRLGSPCGGRGAVPGRGTAGSTDAAGRSGDSPGEPHANGAEEKIVTGEIYRTFSIHTRNIHKKFSTVSENTAESVASKTDTSEATNIKKATTNNEKNNSQSSAPSIKTETNNMVSKSTVITNNSSIPNKPAPSPHQKQISSSPLNNTPASKPVSSIAQHAPASTQNGHATVAKDKDMTKYSLAPDKNKSTPPPTKPKPETNKIGLSVNKQSPAEVKKNTPPHSVQSSIKDKFAAFVGKNTATENLQISVKDSDANIPNDVKQKEQTGQASPKPASFFNKLVQKTLKSKPNPANNTPENKPSAPASKKPVLSQTKSAQSSGRRNIQDIRNSPEINNSPKIPKKDTDETKNKPSSIKDECPKICTTNDKLSHKKPTSPSSNKKPTSPFHNNNSSNIPITNNNSNCNSNTISNKSSALSTQCKTDIDVKEKEKPNSGVERTTSDIESNSITTETDSSKEDNKPNGSVEPMDCTGVCFYKAKCLLQDPSSMGSKEKVKVDESEPSFYEEAPFERRDVTVKSDRWVTDFYMVDSLLGKGKFGEVKKCQERKTGRQLAAKFIEVNGPQDRNDVLNELEIMKNLQHPRLLQLYDAFEVRDKFCLVMELVNGGELFERVINEDFILTEKACVMFTRQICDGIAFMHSQNILHLDMKPENILCLTREGNRIKIIDFGLARKYNPKDDLRVLFGTPEFVAPEVVNFDPISPATDMWSIGVVCYVLLSGLSPFMGESEQETLANVTLARWDFSAEEFDSISSEAKDFISKLLQKDPRKRMNSSDCLEHQWLRRSVKREGNLPERSLSKKRLRKFVYRRKWQKAINAMLALRRMGVTLS